MNRYLLFLLPVAAAMFAAIPPAGNRTSLPADAPSLKHAVGSSQNGQLAAAEAEFKAIIATGSQLAEAFAGLARVYIKMGKVEDANAASVKALDLAPDLTDAHVARGEVYFRQGKIGEAEQEFAAMIRKGTLNARAYLGEARVSVASSFLKQAKEMINMAYGLDHDDPEIRQFRASTFTNDERARQMGISIPADASEPGHPCTLISKTKSTQTDLWKLDGESGHARGYALRVQVNDVAAMLVVDTGRSGILIDQSVAARSNVRRIRNIGFAGTADRAAASGYQGVATSLKIANLEFKDCYVNVVEKNSAIGQDGVIGANVFSDFLVDLNFANETFGLSELPTIPNQPESAPTLKTDTFAPPPVRDRYIASEMKSFVPVFTFGEHMLVSGGVNNSSPSLFMLATGSARSSISISMAKEFTTASLTASRRTQGSNGELKTVYIASDVNLTFGNVKQLDVEILAEDLSRLSKDFGTEISGILGLSSLQTMDIKIDFRDGLIEFNFDANRWR